MKRTILFLLAALLLAPLAALHADLSRLELGDFQSLDKARDESSKAWK